MQFNLIIFLSFLISELLFRLYQIHSFKRLDLAKDSVRYCNDCTLVSPYVRKFFPWVFPFRLSVSQVQSISNRDGTEPLFHELERTRAFNPRTRTSRVFTFELEPNRAEPNFRTFKKILLTLSFWASKFCRFFFDFFLEKMEKGKNFF